MRLRRIALRLAALLLGLQMTGAPDVLANDARPRILPQRADEDWRPLCRNPRLATAPFDALKCISLAPDFSLSLGGEWRERFESATNPGFGLGGPSDRLLLHRLLLHADLRYADSIRAFAQFGYLEQSGRLGGPISTDVNRFDLAQGFIEIGTPVGPGLGAFRVGRQEMSFGSSRLVSVRESPNARRSFDGIRAFWSAPDRRIDVFYAEPVSTQPGAFDDRRNSAQALWGAYATTVLAGPLKADVYWLGYRNDRAAFASIRGREERHTIGTRLFGAWNGFDWDVEAMAQFGRIGLSAIRAWSLASDVGYRFDAPLRPRLGLKANISSGDRNPRDRELQTFNALYPRLPYFSEANLVAPTNLMDVQPYLSIQPIESLTLGIGVDWLWRQTTADAIYAPTLTAYPGTAGAPGRYVGHQVIVDAAWRATDQLTITGQFVHFTPGATLRNAGGDDGQFFTLSAAFKF